MRRLPLIPFVVGTYTVACGEPITAPAPVAPMSTASATPIAPCPDDYQPAVANAGPKPELPPVPDLPELPMKDGDAYTVYGAAHTLRSRYDSPDVTKAAITIVGYIVEANSGPKCAWHKVGKKDPDDCTNIPIPSFTMADAKDTKPDDPKAAHIRVLGFAKNWATMFEATAKYKGLKAPLQPKDIYKDEMWSVDVPFPLPAAGMKVKVTGKYGLSFTKASGGLVSDPKNGVLTYEKMELLP